jgi:hypothetical protein
MDANGRLRNGPRAGKRKRKGGGMGCWAGWWEWVRVWFCFFSFLFFQIHFNQYFQHF